MNNVPVSMENYEHILKRQLTLQRGHWAKYMKVYGIANALYANGFKVIPQLELSIMAGDKNDIPIKVHFDFVLIGETSIRVVELKSNANIPKSPNKSYEMQIHGQTSLLHKYWNEPVFNLLDAYGVLLYEGKTFPEICTEYLGVSITNDATNMNIQGWLLSVSMNEAKAFGPYIPSSSIAKLCEQTAQVQWEHMRQSKIDNRTQIPHSKGFCLLCTWCEYTSSCPKFDGVQIPEWEQTLDELARLKALKEQALEEISVLENQIKQSIFPTELKGKWPLLKKAQDSTACE